MRRSIRRTGRGGVAAPLTAVAGCALLAAGVAPANAQPPATVAPVAALPAPAAARLGAPSAAAPRIAPKLVLVSTRRRAAGAVRVGLRVAVPLRRLDVVLNGRRLSRVLPHGRGQRARVSLGTVHGARFGVNRVLVRAVSRNGRRRQLVRRTVVVRRRAPLVGVRRFEPLVQGRAARLDARRTRAARGGRLRFRWRVVGTPHGARLTLRGARTARPRLVASHPGRYHLALAVAERGGQRQPARVAPAADRVASAAAGRATPAAAPVAPAAAGPAARTGVRSASAAQADPTAACAAPAAAAAQSLQPLGPPPATPSGPPLASTPLELLPPGTQLQTVEPPTRPVAPGPPAQPRTAPGCTLEIVTADVLPNTARIGLAFDSDVRQTAGDGSVQTGIRIGASFVPTGTTGAYVTLLDATTGEVLGSTRVPDGVLVGEEANLRALPWQIQGRRLLTVLTGAPGCCGDDPTVANADAGFTILQASGQPLDDAVRNLGLRLGEGPTQSGPGPVGAPGELTGWLQQSIALDGEIVYTYVGPDRAAFETQQPGPAPGSNTMTVGGVTYPGELPAGASAGFQVLVTDAALRPQLGSPVVFGTNTGDPGRNASAEQAMAELLQRATATPGTTVFVQSVGRPVPASQYAQPLAAAIEALGGDDWLFLSLDGSGDYALVGGPPAPGQTRSPQDAAEASTQWSGGGELHGMLRRRSDQALRATLADQSPTGSDYALGPIVFQDPTPWPQTDTAGKRAATTYLAQQTGMLGTACYVPARPDFRSDYCDVNLDPDTISLSVGAVPYPADASFSRSEFRQVAAQLQRELGMVAETRTLMANLASPFHDARAGDQAQDVAGYVMKSLDQKKPSMGPAISGDLSMASALLYFAADVTEGPMVGPMASVLDLASEVTTEEGEPEPYWEALQEAADLMGAIMDDRLDAITDNLAAYQDIVVSDYGKLSAVAGNATDTWSWNAQTQADAGARLNAGIGRWMWTAILPAGYDLVGLPGVPLGLPSLAECVEYTDGRNVNFVQPWLHADPRTTLFPLVGWAAGRPVSNAMYALLHGKPGSDSAKVVRAPARGQTGLADRLFGSGGAGLVAPWLLDRASWTYQWPRMITWRDRHVKVGWCDIGSP